MSTDTSRAPRGTSGAGLRTSGAGLGATVASEIAKIRTTRLWWILVLSCVGYCGLMAAFMGANVGLTSSAGADGPALAPLDAALSVYTLAPTIGYVFPLVLGALAITHEVRHRTVSATYLAQPRRWRVVVAKLISQAGLGALIGVAGVVTALVLGAVALQVTGADPMLGSSQVWVTAAFSVLALMLWGVIGVGVGTLVSNQVMAIVGILAFTQFVEPILRLMFASVDALEAVGKFLPGAAAEALVGNSLYSATGLMDLLPRWQGGLVLLAYVLVLAGVGSVTTIKRDVT